uniref:CPG4 domain-containing protein n=1 Tax=Strongyloides stercoralis TaxID=6248 RepID=A0A0K0EQY7_STRER
MNNFFKLLKIYILIFVIISSILCDISPCLKECIKPIEKIKKDFSYLMKNFEKSCDILEEQAKRSKKCDLHDQKNFYTATSFYRLYCIDFEEEIEENLECLKRTASKADLVCKEKCNSITKVPKNNKIDKEKIFCKQLECSNICYFKELSTACPNVKETLLKINLRQAEEMYSTTKKEVLLTLPVECQNLHDTRYIKNKFLS